MEDENQTYFVMLNLNSTTLDALILLARNFQDGDAQSDEVIYLAIDDGLQLQDAYLFVNSIFAQNQNMEWHIDPSSDYHEANKVISVSKHGIMLQSDLCDKNTNNFVFTARTSYFDLDDLHTLVCKGLGFSQNKHTHDTTEENNE